MARESECEMMEPVEVGATVVATDGEVGTVEQVVTNPTTGDMRLLIVRTTAGDRIEIPVSLLETSSTTPREVRLASARATLTARAGITTAGGTELETIGDHLVIPVREEILVPTKQPIELGEVRIHKRVETVPYEALVDVTRDDIAVDRVAVNRQVDAVPAPRQEGDTLVIPVVEEVLVTEKRLMLREEIRVTRRQVTESVPVRDTLRREVVEIEDPDPAPTAVNAPAAKRRKRGGNAGNLPLS
jgi:uncharacterized protein (TIGR02271 family)